MKDDNLLDSEGTITGKGAELGALVLVKELDKFIADIGILFRVIDTLNLDSKTRL